MENTFTYQQAIFGLLLMGARADGELQNQEKELIVDLTSEKHVLNTDEYRQVIDSMTHMKPEEFSDKVYHTLRNQPFKAKMEAVYWLIKLLKVDKEYSENLQQINEVNIFHESIKALEINSNDVMRYEIQKDEN